MDAWHDLEEFVTALREQNAEWSKGAAALEEQINSFKPVADQVETHFADLAVNDALLAIARQALRDAARLHNTRLHFGLARVAALVWYPMDDPRPALSTAPPDSQYSVEVRIGPRYLLGVSGTQQTLDQRLSILIAGEKQLVATLPTTPDRFRAALLRAFQAPAHSGLPPEQSESAGEVDSATEAEPLTQPAGTTEPMATEAEARPAPPDPDTAIPMPAAE